MAASNIEDFYTNTQTECDLYIGLDQMNYLVYY